MNNSSQVVGRGKNKRKWSVSEEEVMLDFIMELKADPRWKSEGGFKNGFHLALEEKMENKFPSCGLKASQIESKIKFLKEKYTAIHDLLKMSGSVWDDNSKMVQCERQAFDDFCKDHPRAKGLWKTSFPLFDKLELIFGRDRADGGRAEGFDDSILYMDRECVDLEDELDDDLTELSTQPPSKRQRKGKSSFGPTKKNDTNDKFVIAINAIKDHMGTIASSLKEAQKREQDIVDQKKNLLSEIASIDGMSPIDAIDATRFLSRTPSELDAFYSCPNDEWKKLYVERLIDRIRRQE